MSPVTVFRCTLVLSPAVALLGAAASALATSTYSQDWQDLFAWSGDGAWLLGDDSENMGVGDLLTVGALAMLCLAAIANQIAMFFFWPPSRLCYCLLGATGFGLTLGLGLTVQPPWETLGYELSASLAGITLAMAYLPPVADKFKNNANDSGDAYGKA
jgi:hypothetical protein